MEMKVEMAGKEGRPKLTAPAGAVKEPRRKRHYGKGRERYIPTSFALPPEMLEQLALTAELEETSRSILVRKAIAALLWVKGAGLKAREA